MKDPKIHKSLLAIGASMLLAWVVLSPQQSAQGEPKAAAAGQQTLESQAMNVLDTYCISCHGPDQQKGKTRFDALETIDTVDQQALFITAQDAVHFEEMPPAKAKQPTAAERAVLLKWFKEQLTGTAANKLAEKLRRPEAGNYVDHHDLFSGEYADLPGSTEDRRWLISEYIFNEKFNRILKHTPRRDIDGKRYMVQGDSKRHLNLTNPFLLPNNAGIRYYANETLNGGHLLTMLTNAKDAADYMLELAERDRSYLSSVDSILAQEVANRKTLESRRQFLNHHIERVLQDIYLDKHEKLLPKFVRVEVPEPIAEDSDVKKAPYHAANPGRAEVEVIFRSMRRLKKEGQSNNQII